MAADEKIKYFKYFPGGNTTALVFSDEKKSAGHISKEIMAGDKSIEQVGFVVSDGKTFRLQMMGGELCVNAARSAAHYWIKDRNINQIEFEVSGFDGKMLAKKQADKIELSIPKAIIIKKSQVFDGYLVELQGISYLIHSKKDLKPEELVRAYYNGSPAFGIIYVETLGNQQFKINPVVWVKETGTFINETACGSGSIAACVPYLQKEKNEKYTVEQPSGQSYDIFFNFAKNEIVVRGEVAYLGEKELNISA